MRVNAIKTKIKGKMANTTMTSKKWVGKWFLITGAARCLGLPPSADTALVLDAVKEKLTPMKLRDWVGAVEEYKEGEHAGEFHVHIVIQTYKETTGGCVRRWFPRLNVRGCHPSGGDDTAWNYSLKDGFYVMKEKHQGQRKDLEEMQQHLKDGKDLDFLWENYLSRMVQYWRSFTQYDYVLKRKREFEPDEDVDNERFVIGFNDDWTKPLIVGGESGLGKSAWACAHFVNPCVVSDIEDLRDLYNPNFHDGIVFDDCDFRHWPRTAQIHLLDIKFPRTLRMRNTNWVRPKGVKMIFTHNPNEFPFVEDPAIQRRVNKRFFEHPLYN